MSYWDFHTHQADSSGAIFNASLNQIPLKGFFSAGLHPWFLSNAWKEDFGHLEQLALSQNRLLAVGEAGFDRLKGPELSMQKEAFSAQAQLAKALDIPLILHCVRGHDLLLAYLKSTKPLPQIIWHGWNLKPDLGRQLLEYPVYFSFGKHILKPESNASQWLEECPSDRIFLETDDSGLEISSVYRAASLILRLPVEEVAKLTLTNWNRISKRKINE
ncbi:MAG: TatD family hydrolase [Algoriphagus aquaeductus]|uniref:TatD family hydrolase n=1 Tax=Algoriphagus aquaeductus TaxID=475299 RepID=UPI00391D7AC0